MKLRDPALRVQLRAVGVFLECLFQEILALGTELTAPQVLWLPVLLEALSNSVQPLWVLNSRELLNDYNLPWVKSWKTTCSCIRPRTNFSRPMGCLKFRLLEGSIDFWGVLLVPGHTAWKMASKGCCTHPIWGSSAACTNKNSKFVPAYASSDLT